VIKFRHNFREQDGILWSWSGAVFLSSPESQV